MNMMHYMNNMNRMHCIACNRLIAITAYRNLGTFFIGGVGGSSADNSSPYKEMVPIGTRLFKNRDLIGTMSESNRPSSKI